MGLLVWEGSNFWHSSLFSLFSTIKSLLKQYHWVCLLPWQNNWKRQLCKLEEYCSSPPAWRVIKRPPRLQDFSSHKNQENSFRTSWEIYKTYKHMPHFNSIKSLLSLLSVTALCSRPSKSVEIYHGFHRRKTYFMCLFIKYPRYCNWVDFGPYLSMGC